MARVPPQGDPPPAGPPHVIGWKEYIDFPEWNIRRIKAKIDTGARTSALHVDAYHVYEKEGDLWAELRLSLRRRRPDEVAVVHTPVLGLVSVTDSGGHKQTRPLIGATVRLGPVSKHVLFTVTNRADMLFRILLGRTALASDFVVDVSRKYAMRRRKRKP